MYIQNRFPTPRLLRITWHSSLRVLPVAIVLSLVWHFTPFRGLQLPALPVTILGTAVSFYLGFKGNSAYDRLWEARKIWGGIVNTSRTWGIHTTAFVAADQSQEASAALHQELVYRHIAWLQALRIQLRRRKSWEHDRPVNNDARKAWGTFDTSDEALRDAMAPYLDPAELRELMTRKNRATQLLHHQSSRLRELRQQDQFDDFRHMELAELLETMFTLQGKAERIKNFPLPRQYATAAHIFVQTFLQVVPFGLVPACAALGPNLVWLAIPASMMLAWVFSTWDTIVDYSENPFEGLINDIPMTALARTIEIDMREMLGETDLPAPIAAQDNVLL